MGSDGSNDVSFDRIPSLSRHTMKIMKACVAAVHPDLQVLMFEAVCLNGCLINEHHTRQEGRVRLQPPQQVPSHLLPLGRFLL